MNIRNAFAALALASIGAFAALPTTMLFQGNLAVDGTAKTGTTKLVVALYDAPTSGTKVWEETFTEVALVKGAFAVQLGASKALPAFDKPLYVQLTADGKVAATRVPLTLAPYAAMAAAIPNVRSSADTTYLDASTVNLGADGAIEASAAFGADSRRAGMDAKITDSGSKLELVASVERFNDVNTGGLRLTDSLTTLYAQAKQTHVMIKSSLNVDPWNIQILADTLAMRRVGSVIATPVLHLTPAYTQGTNSNMPVCDETSQGAIIYAASYQGGAASFKGCVYLGAGTGNRFAWQTLNAN